MLLNRGRGAMTMTALLIRDRDGLFIDLIFRAEQGSGG